MKVLFTVITLLLIVSGNSQDSLSVSKKEANTSMNEVKKWKPSPYYAKNYTIDIVVEGLEDSVVYLANYYKDQNYVTDSTTRSNDGHYVFKGDQKEGGIYILANAKKQIVFQFVVSDPVTILKTNMEDPTGNMKVMKSEENIAFFKYWKFTGKKYAAAEKMRGEKQIAEQEGDEEKIKSLNDELDEMQTELSAFQKQFRLDYPDAFVNKVLGVPSNPILPDLLVDSDDSVKLTYYREHYWDNVDFNDARLIRTPVLHKKIMDYYDKGFVSPDAVSVIKELDRMISMADKSDHMKRHLVTTFLAKYENPKIMCQEGVFVHLVDKYLRYKNLDWYDDVQMAKIITKADEMKPCLCGNVAQNLKLKDKEGKLHEMHKIDANYTVLYFWSATCGHCKKTTPKVKKFYEDYKSKGVEVYGINTDSEGEDYLEYLEKNELNWINVQDTMHLSNFRYYYNITSTPIIYLLDENKKIIGRRLDPKNLAIIIDREIGEFDENKDYEQYAVPSSKKHDDEH